MNFEYIEDEEFFESLFKHIGGLKGNHLLFDFRHPFEKRTEFNKIRKSVRNHLIEQYGNSCQLNCHDNCQGTGTQVDHLMPLSSNVLNKRLRSIKAKDGKKTPTQSFGSNDMSNFVLACKRCNNFKMNKFPDKELLRHVGQVRESN